MSIYMENFETIYGVSNNIQVLKDKVLELAIRGRLTDHFKIEKKESSWLKESIETSKLKLTGKKIKPIQSDIPDRENYPERWELLTIGDVFNLINGRAFKPNEWSDKGFPIIRIQNLNNIDAPFNYCNFEVDKKFIVNNNDILIGWSGTPGTSFGAFVWKYGEGVLNQHIFNAIPYYEMNREFLKYAINSKLNEMISKAHGGVGLQHITKGKFEDIVIPIPSLKEQNLIVSKIESFMLEIEKLEKLLRKKEYIMGLLPKAVVDVIGRCKTGEELKEKLQFVIVNFKTIFQTAESIEDLRKVILQFAIEGKLVLQEPNDEPGLELLKKIQIEKNELVRGGKNKTQSLITSIEEDEIPFEIPESWCWIKLKCVGVTQTGTTPKTSAIEYYNGEIPFIKPGDINSKGINYDNESLTQLGIKAGRLIEKNSNMMVCIGGSIGKVYYTDRECSCNQQINTLTTYSVVNHIFMHFVLSSPYFYNQVWELSSGTATPIINKSTWEAIPIPLPPFEEQCRIVKRVKSIMNLISQMEEEIKRKDKLIKQLASG